MTASDPRSTCRSPDVTVLRDLSRRYADLAARPEQDARRRLWRDHNSLLPTRPPVLVGFGMWNLWCRELFADAVLKCTDPWYREYERTLRILLFHGSLDDDWIAEPWLTVPARRTLTTNALWGLEPTRTEAPHHGGAWKWKPPLRQWADLNRLTAPPHAIDEQGTRRDLQKLGDAIGDLLPLNVERGPVCQGFNADISTHLAQLRGLDRLMLDMFDSPRELHRLLAFMRDGILANQAAAETAGDCSLTSQKNQCMTYCRELPAPQPNRHGAGRKQLWTHAAAQEFALVSPAMHEEFMLQYQQPIIESWGLCAYGCCENLTEKIGMLRRLRNLRIIAVAPSADLARCAARIGSDYVISWRPNPTDMVCAGYDEKRIARIVRQALDSCRDGVMHIILKDVETVEGDLNRLPRWVRLVKDLGEGA